MCFFLSSLIYNLDSEHMFRTNKLTFNRNSFFLFNADEIWIFSFRNFSIKMTKKIIRSIRSFIPSKNNPVRSCRRLKFDNRLSVSYFFLQCKCYLLYFASIIQRILLCTHRKFWFIDLHLCNKCDTILPKKHGKKPTTEHKN